MSPREMSNGRFSSSRCGPACITRTLLTCWLAALDDVPDRLVNYEVAAL